MPTPEHRQQQSEQLEKVCVPLSPNAWHGCENEWMWAARVSRDDVILKNVPFYAKNLSCGDRVRVKDKDGARVVTDVVARGGHSTYRLIAESGRTAPAIVTILDELIAIGCELESATDTLVSIDVLPMVDVYCVYRILEEAEKSGLIDFEEGHCGHPLRQ